MNELKKSTKGKILELDRDKIELLKRTIAKGATDDEFSLFLNQSKRTGLDPFSRQIHLVKRKRWNAEKNMMEEVATIQVGIDGYRLIAERTGRYIPGEITYREKDGVLISATATVFKIYEDKPYPVPAEARFDEYCPRSKEGKILGLWTKMPYLMLGKCAEALALRKAFPQELSGIYTDAEMSQSDSEDRDIKKETRVTASKDAKESQKVLNTQAQIEIDAGRLQVASPPAEPTVEEIREEVKEVFGNAPSWSSSRPSIPPCPVLPMKPIEALKKEMTELMAFEVAGSQGSFKRFEEPPPQEANPIPKFKVQICQEIWMACKEKTKTQDGTPEEALKTASSFTTDDGKKKFLTFDDLVQATRESKWHKTTLRKLDILEEQIPF